ncbi:MAG: Gfo/Idh/MocA family oxidoreductase [Helcococcus sp.]|nr:Gfo/Idh/MocA family oxidoreductase [Helcococcus sp.]
MINWAVIGTGVVANLFSEQFNKEKANLYAVYSRNKEKAIEFSKKYSIKKAYDDYKELLLDDNIDIVYIATPHNTHYKYIMEALKAGKNVLAEKVIVLNSKQLFNCVKLAKEKNLFLAEGMTIHYMPIYREIREWISEYNLGPLKMIQANFGSFKNFEDRYFFKKELAGGALFDIGVYALNLVRYFLTSKPTEIKTIVNLHESGVDESSAIILKNDENELATISLTFRAKMPKRVVIAYENGYVEINEYPQADEAILYRTSGGKEVLQLGDERVRFKYEMEYISNLIANSKENDMLEYTIDVLEIMDKVRKEWGLKYKDE